MPIAERGIVGRGVLLDIARFRGKPALDRAETFDASRPDGMRPGAGRRHRAAQHPAHPHRLGRRAGRRDSERVGEDYWEPGLTFSLDLVRWFDEMQIPCLVTDTLANETTYEPETGMMLVLHAALMRNLGIVFTEMASLDDLAADCAADRHYEGFYCASPIRGQQRHRRLRQIPCSSSSTSKTERPS